MNKKDLPWPLDDYKLDDLIIYGDAAKSRVINELEEILGIDDNDNISIDIGSDDYDHSLEIFLIKDDNEIDIESFCTPENMDKITEVTGSTHFWMNLCVKKDGKRIKYADIHVGWIKANKPEYWSRTEIK